jgi:Kazal-type serine protease inhibitor-like protein
MVRLTTGNCMRIAAVTLAGLVLAACEPTGPGYGGPDYGGPGYGGPGYGNPGGRACARIYDPVCATRGPQSQTFPNSCEAISAGWQPRHGGQCRGSGGPGYDGSDWGGRPWVGPGGQQDGGHQGRPWVGPGGQQDGGRHGRRPGTPRPERPQFCTSIYQPVCGSDGGRARTFENECLMRQAGARQVPERFCRRG